MEYYSGLATTGTPLTTGGAQADDTVRLACTDTGQDALTNAAVAVANGAWLVVRCDADCGTTDATAVYSASAKLYLLPSSVCRAAVHAGVTATQPFKLKLSTGSADANTDWLSACAGEAGLELVACSCGKRPQPAATLPLRCCVCASRC